MPQAVVLPAFEPQDGIALADGTRIAMRALNGALVTQSMHVRMTGPACRHFAATPHMARWLRASHQSSMAVCHYEVRFCVMKLAMAA